MPDATTAAMHIKRAIETWVSADDDGTEIEQAIDDAGVREAWEALEWIIRDASYKAPEQLDPLHQVWLNKIKVSLAALTGTKVNA